jgi:hypothetical protein
MKDLGSGERVALDEFKGSDKQGEFDSISEIEIGFTSSISGWSSAGSSQPLR